MQKFRPLVSGILLFAALLAGVSGAGAQGPAKPGKAEPVVEETQPTPERPSGAPFMKPLSRLATILGSVHFLRGLCGDENAAIWRDRMNQILAAQSPSPPDKEALVASFNSGYRSFASVYRRCTPAARVAAARYQEEGVTLSRDIAARYGN